MAFGWVYGAAHFLGRVESGGAEVRAKPGGPLGAMRRHRPEACDLAGAVGHFVKVGRSYWPGLFRRRDVAELPRTNNDPEQAFGSHRYHERRSTGRKGASPALVSRGSARFVAIRRGWWRGWRRVAARGRRRTWRVRTAGRGRSYARSWRRAVSVE